MPVTGGEDGREVAKVTVRGRCAEGVVRVLGCAVAPEREIVDAAPITEVTSYPPLPLL